jgi:pre-mRNA-processing factor 19
MGVPMAADDTVETGLTQEVVSRMQETAKALSKTRKKKEFPDLAPVDKVKTMKVTGSHPIHQSTAPGILCVDVHKSDDNRIVTGGVDQQVILFDASTNKLAQKLMGHSKKVTCVQFHPSRDIVLSASQDATARVWSCTDVSNWRAPYTCSSVVRRHKAEVTGLSLHPTGEYFLTSSRDKSWALHDLASGRCVKQVNDLPVSYGCMKFHPDGLILAGGGEDKNVVVWDLKDQVTVATLQGHEGEVEALAFSENGYYLATASTDGTVKLWDLRKPINIQTLQVSDGPVSSVAFDSTGQYLAVGAESLKIFNFEKKASLAATMELRDHTAAVTGVAFGQHARSIASVSMDRMLKICKVA